ncbi:MAG: acyl carrier protein [Chlamydiae bacterium RIFCSPHIGHO2_12_FULL_49_11]|nr:MAG: acyl carrier protein [Chlamydiae bacterium RIFCSPHIGHO2_12_FULL_49_11]
MSDIQKEIVEIIVDQLGVEESEVSPEKSFVEDLNADSLDQTELIMALEEKMGVEISEKDATGLKTVGDVITFIEKKKSEIEA